MGDEKIIHFGNGNIGKGRDIKVLLLLQKKNYIEKRDSEQDKNEENAIKKHNLISTVKGKS